VSIEKAGYSRLSLDTSLIWRPLCILIEKKSAIDTGGRRPV
jgi:hypothetical protein